LTKLQTVKTWELFLRHSVDPCDAATTWVVSANT